MTQRRPAVVVLAAGRGMRFHGVGHKLEQRVELAGADTILARTLRHAMDTQLRVVLVTTPTLAPAALRLLPADDVVILPSVDSSGRPAGVGMGYSIAAGVSAAGDAEGWLIVPADMPLLRPDSILAVAGALAHYPVAYAQHTGRPGHPVGFSSELYSELVNLKGDEGARRIVARYPAHAVDLDDPGVLVDVDTADDLARLRNTQPPNPPNLPKATLKPA